MADAVILDSLWILIASALVLLMQIGFCALEAGVVRAKNTINVAAKNITDLCVSGLAFWAVGAGVMFAEGRFADGAQGSGAAHSWALSFLVFQIMFCGTATTIMSGAVAERMRYGAYTILVAVVTLVVYPMTGSWAWQGIDGGAPGWLEARGFVDFAGSTVVHSLGGWAALAALLVIGPRMGRFEAGAGAPLQSSNIPLSAIGVGLMWVGWIGFNGGSTLALNDQLGGIILNTILAGCAGGCAAQAVSWLRDRSVSVYALLNGILAGLVGITAGCHMVDEPAAVLIGAIAGALMTPSFILLERLKIDDAVGAIPVHLIAGIWGTLAVAFLARPGTFEISMLDQLGIQALGIAAIGAYAFPVCLVIFYAINTVLPLRASPEAEIDGFNVTEHDASNAVTNLIMDMERQRQTGDLGEPVRVEHGSEVETVAIQYNRVVTKIRRDSKKLEKAYDEILKAKAAAESASLAKTSFLANMSHELRTPLNAIIGFSELMQNEAFGPLSGEGRYKEYSETIHEAGTHLLSLVNDLLEHSRIESGQAEIREGDIDLQRLIGSIARMTQDAANRAEVELSVDLDDDIPILVGDERLVKQIVLNLVSNAIKFTNPKGRVQIIARLEADNRIALVVSDTGIGMSRDGIAEAMEPFKQLQDHHAKEYAGTGLGLPLVKAMLRMHQGTLTIDSIEGHGTTATARFPDARTRSRPVLQPPALNALNSGDE
jgi:Amt family ammonium transporter